MRKTKRGAPGALLKADNFADLRQLQRISAKRAKRANPPSKKLAMSADHAPTASPGALSADDIALFRRVVQGVSRARPSSHATLPPAPVASPAQLLERRQHAMGQAVTPPLPLSDHFSLASLHHDNTQFLQSGQGRQLIKALRKGKWPVQATLDLHGANVEEARLRFDRFILTCQDHQIRCVRVVHGKGYGSKNGEPVLKDTVRRWLSQVQVVLAYIECAEHDGGSGAVTVLLKKSSL